MLNSHEMPMSCWWKSQHSRYFSAFFEVIAKQKARAAKTKLDNTLEEQLLGGKPETSEAETTETPGWWCLMEWMEKKIPKFGFISE